MKLMDLKKCIIDLYETGDAFHLIGPPGVGKSDIIRYELRDILSAHYAEEFGYWDVLLPTVDAPDIRGFLVPTKDKDGHPSSFFTRSAILPPRDYLAAHPRGIYLIDERNSADLLTQKATAPIVLSKRFGEEYLPKDWIIVSASNRVEDRAGVLRSPTHLVNREKQINIEPDVTSWAMWAEEHQIHPMMVAFAKRMPGVVFSETVPKKDGPFCTPRSFVAAGKHIARAAGVDKNGNPKMEIPVSSLLQQLVGASIGDGATAQLFGFLKVGDQLPTIEEIEKDPMGAKCPKDLSAAYAAVQMCIHHAAPTNVDTLWQYAERLPKELQVSAALSLVEKGRGALLNSRRLGEWIMQNKALIIASN